MLAIGAAVGAYGTVVGAGGGFLLVPILRFMYPSVSPEVITSISLTVVFFNAASGSLAYARMGRIDYRSGLLFGACAIPGAVLGAIATGYLSLTAFNLMLGVVLVLAGGALAIWPISDESPDAPKAEGGTRRVVTERNGQVHEYSFNAGLGAFISSIVGFLSSILGIGGGIIHVPILSRVLRFPVHIATATSHFMLAIMSLAGALVHLSHGTLQHEGVRTTAVVLGVLPGAQLGAVLSGRLHGALILRLLALALVAVGLRLTVLTLQR